MPDEARRVPGRAGGELVLLQHDHVRAVVAREVIGGRAADDAAADDDDLGVGGKVFAHSGEPRLSLWVSRARSNFARQLAA